jgi:hypothetical protein
MIRSLLLAIAVIYSYCCCAQLQLSEVQTEYLPVRIDLADAADENSITESKLKDLRKKRTRNYILTGSLALLSGAADGLNQALQFRYDGFKRVFPGANDQFWKPTISCNNKYKNGDPKEGARFPGSRTWLVFVTDGYHLTRFTSHLFMTGAIGIKIAGYEKKKWYKYLLEGAGYWLVNRVGFVMVYNRF